MTQTPPQDPTTPTEPAPAQQPVHTPGTPIMPDLPPVETPGTDPMITPPPAEPLPDSVPLLTPPVAAALKAVSAAAAHLLPGCGRDHHLRWYATLQQAISALYKALDNQAFPAPKPIEQQQPSQQEAPGSQTQVQAWADSTKQLEDRITNLESDKLNLEQHVEDLQKQLTAVQTISEDRGNQIEQMLKAPLHEHQDPQPAPAAPEQPAPTHQAPAAARGRRRQS